MDKGLQPLFPKKGDVGIEKIHRGIPLTSITTKIYNTQLLNRIEPEIEKILWKNQNEFRRNRSTTSQILIIHRILFVVYAKNLGATLLFVDFSKAFVFIHRGMMEQILLAYGLPREIVEAIIRLNKNTKVKICSPDGDTDFFDIVAGVLQGDIFAPYSFTICLDYVLPTLIDLKKENGISTVKGKKQTILSTKY